MQFFYFPRRTLLSLACLQAFFVLSFSALADEQNKTDVTAAEGSLERLSVYGQRQRDTFGSKSGILLKELPQSIQLFNVDQMQGQGLVSVGDLLRDIPSANPGYSQSWALSVF